MPEEMGVPRSRKGQKLSSWIGPKTRPVESASCRRHRAIFQFENRSCLTEISRNEKPLVEFFLCSGACHRVLQWFKFHTTLHMRKMEKFLQIGKPVGLYSFSKRYYDKQNSEVYSAEMRSAPDFEEENHAYFLASK